MPLDRVRIIDYVKFGELVVTWAIDPATRPAEGDLQEFKKQVRDLLILPERIEKVRFVEVGEDELVIRLPNPRMAQESYMEFTQWQDATEYPIPLFYRNLRDRGNTMSAIDTLYSRVADYTISQCR